MNFACVALHRTDQEQPILLVDAGEAPLTYDVRIIQEFRLPKDGFGLCGRPRFSLRVEDEALPVDEAEASSWQTLLHKGISKLKSAGDNWERWSASRPDEMTQSMPR